MTKKVNLVIMPSSVIQKCLKMKISKSFYAVLDK